MENDQATLLLTRPEPQSKEFLALCEKDLQQRLPVVISPLLQIENQGTIPDLDKFQTLIMTSGNGVRRLAELLAYRKVVTVGENTATLARAQGAHAAPLGENIEEFLANAQGIDAPALYCRGVHTRGDLAKNLNELGITTEETVLYDQVSRPLSQAARALLIGTAPIVAPVFSPRTASFLSQYTATAPLTVIAMSKAVADAWTNTGKVVIADNATAAAMCAKVTEAF